MTEAASRSRSSGTYFIDNDEPYPVIATTSRLLSTGVDAKTCKLIVLDQTINSMTQFKQILGRGTRIREDYNKLYFTIMDFKGATRLFQDPEFDGEPVTVHEPAPLDRLRAQAGHPRALRDQGLPLAVLAQAVPNGEALDAFDLIAHVAFDQPPLSRRERAEQVRKRNYFGKYGDQAQAVMDALLEKYADHGIGGIEDPQVLELPPFDKLGGKRRIRRDVFGGPEKFFEVLTELERQLYKESA